MSATRWVTASDGVGEILVHNEGGCSGEIQLVDRMVRHNQMRRSEGTVTVYVDQDADFGGDTFVCSACGAEVTGPVLPPHPWEWVG